MTAPARKPAEPLLTRHVFLDTEVYRRAGFNISNKPFSLLAEQTAAGRIVLHHTDITLAEIHRQLKNLVLEKAVEAKRLAKDFDRLARIAGRTQSTVGAIDGPMLADATWDGFVDGLVGRFGSRSILALELPARAVFDRYFAGLPPFDDRGSKEFPDAFVVEALAAYCKTHGVTMYVVSGDAALRRAASGHDTLVALETIDEVLAASTAEIGANFEALVDDVYAAPGFDQQLIHAVEADLDFVEFIYWGPLRDGSVRSARLAEIVGVDDYGVAAFDGAKIGLILHAAAILESEIEYLDEHDLRNRDDDVVATELTTSTRSHVRLKVFVSIELATLRFLETELLTQQLLIE